MSQEILIPRAMWATRAQFAVLGLLSGAWGAHVPSIKQRFELDEAGLSLVLLAAALGVLASLGFAGRVVGQFGARRTAALVGTMICLVFGAILQVSSQGALWVLAFVFGANASLFDVSINSEGAELEHRGGRPVMSQLHGMFSLGAMGGAGLAAALLHAAVPAELQMAGLGLALLPVVWLASAAMLPALPEQADDDGGSSAPPAAFAWPRGRLLVIGLLILAGMIAEGVMYDWSVLYLKQELGLPQAEAALGYAVFAAAMAAARFGGDAMRSRYDEMLLLRVGASVACVAMSAVLVFGLPWLAYVGFALVGVGVALVAPILFNAASRVQGVSRAAAIASATSVGYAGFMIGPPLIGGLAQASSLTAALGVVALAAGVLAVGTRWVAQGAPTRLQTAR